MAVSAIAGIDMRPEPGDCQRPSTRAEPCHARRGAQGHRSRDSQPNRGAGIFTQMAQARIAELDWHAITRRCRTALPRPSARVEYWKGDEHRRRTASQQPRNGSQAVVQHCNTEKTPDCTAMTQYSSAIRRRRNRTPYSIAITEHRLAGRSTTLQ